MIRRTLLAMVFVMSGFFAGMVLTGRMHSAEDARAAEPPASRSVEPQLGGMATMPDLSAVAARDVPSVMNISSLQVVRQASPYTSDPLFRYFFGDRDDMLAPRNRVSQSLGSGVVVSSDGYILTNNHVIGDARAQVSVVMPDKVEKKAKIVGVDEFTDIALLKIDAHGLPVLPWGDSSKLKVAEWVLAIGNPFQLNQTVTLGIVSALGRTLGGNLARHVMDDLLKYGEVQRGAIPGVMVISLTTQLADELGAASTRGALINQMTRQSDAYAAGLRPGDIIVSFNGRPVDDASAFMRMLADSKVGTSVKLEILRESRRLEVTVPITRSRSTRTAR